MKVTVTPTCRHEDGWTSSGEPMTGSHVIVSREGVWLNRVKVIRRDRRMHANRTPGHPWLSSNDHPDPAYRNIGWTSFSVEVEP